MDFRFETNVLSKNPLITEVVMVLVQYCGMNDDFLDFNGDLIIFLVMCYPQRLPCLGTLQPK